MNKHLLVLGLALGAGNCLAALPSVPVGSVITNQATVHLSDGTTEVITYSNRVQTTVIPVGGVLVTPNSDPAVQGSCGQTSYAAPGGNGVLTWTVQNTGNQTDTIALSFSEGGTYTLYRETDGTAGLSSGDTVLNGQVTLGAQKSTTIYGILPVPAGAAGLNEYRGTLTATSGLNPDITDTDNAGCVIAQRILSLEMTQVPAQRVPSPSTVTFTHALSNTSNAPLTADEVSVLRGDTGQDTLSASFTVTDTQGRSATNTVMSEALQQLLRGREPWAAGEVLTWTTQVTVPRGVPAGTVNITDPRPYITVANSASTVNVTPQAAAAAHPEQLTVLLQASGTIEKRQSLCSGGNVGTCGEPTAAELSLNSCDVVRYSLNGRNSGETPLFTPVLRDTVPQNSSGIWLNTPQGLLSRVGSGPWQSGAVPITASAGTVIEFGADTNADGTINATDALPAGGELRAELYVQAAGASCPAPSGQPQPL